MSPPPPPPSPMQGHRRRHWIGSPPPPLYPAIESELPRHWRPRGCIQGGIGVHAAAAVKLHKVEEPNYGSTVYTQRYQSYDPNNGIRARLQVCNPNPNRVKAKRKRDRLTVYRSSPPPRMGERSRTVRRRTAKVKKRTDPFGSE